jgi:hypothetical protein
LFLTTILLVGCATTEGDWQQAKTANTVSAYANFLAKHPHGSHVDDANAAMENLDWTTARGLNTAAAYKDFLAKHSQGSHADEAKAAFENLDWNTAEQSGTPDAFLDFYHRHPTTSRFRKMTGDIVSDMAVLMKDGIGLVGWVVLVKIGGRDIGIHPSQEEAVRLGLIERRQQATMTGRNICFIGQAHNMECSAHTGPGEKTLKGSTLLILPTPGGSERIVAVKAAEH